MQLDPLVPPQPDDYTDADRFAAHRRYHTVVGIVFHNEPIDTQGIGTVASYHSREFPNGVRPVIKRASKNGDLRRARDGWVTTSAVTY